MSMLKKLQKDNPTGEMSFLDHLEALRWHLIRSLIAVLIIAITAFLNKKFIFDGIIFAPVNSDFLTYRILCFLATQLNMDICIKGVSFSIISTELAAQFTLHMWVSFISGVVLAFPYIIWELWRFIKPALHDKEQKYSKGIVFFTSSLFLIGVLFGYYIMTPLSISFLGTYQVSPDVKNLISISSYISTVSILVLASGIVFELPIVIYFLSKLGLITPSFMRKYRKHALVVILIVAAIITPTPDVSGQILVSIPLYILYEVSIYVSSMVVRNEEK